MDVKLCVIIFEKKKLNQISEYKGLKKFEEGYMFADLGYKTIV